MRRLVVRACAAPMRAMSGMASPGSMLKHGGSGGPGVEPSSLRGRGGAMVGTRCRIEGSGAEARGGDGRTLATGGCVRRWGLTTGSGAEPRRNFLHLQRIF